MLLLKSKDRWPKREIFVQITQTKWLKITFSILEFQNDNIKQNLELEILQLKQFVGYENWQEKLLLKEKRNIVEIFNKFIHSWYGLELSTD